MNIVQGFVFSVKNEFAFTSYKLIVLYVVLFIIIIIYCLLRFSGHCCARDNPRRVHTYGQFRVTI